MIQSKGGSHKRKPKQTHDFLVRPDVKSVGRWNLFVLVCIYVVTVGRTTHGLGKKKSCRKRRLIADISRQTCTQKDYVKNAAMTSEV